MKGATDKKVSHGTHILLVEDGEPADIEAVGDSLGCGEAVKAEELRAVDGVDQALAHAQRVQPEVDLELHDDDVQRGQLLLPVSCAPHLFASAGGSLNVSVPEGPADIFAA